MLARAENSAGGGNTRTSFITLATRPAAFASASAIVACSLRVNSAVAADWKTL
jgi:hypothetical protein